MDFYYRIPSMVYAEEVRGVANEREARKEVRERKELKRLPRGTEFWRKA